MASAYTISQTTLSLPVRTMNIQKHHTLLMLEENIVQLVHFSSNHTTYLCTAHKKTELIYKL
jgi:hypothetical protein